MKDLSLFEDMARDITITALDGLRECLLTEEVFSAEYRVYKDFLISGLSYLEAKQFMKQRRKQPLNDTYLPRAE